MIKKLVFGSEQKAILEQPAFDRVINKKALLEYFTFQNIFTDQTLLEGIHLLKAGHYATIDLQKVTKSLNLRNIGIIILGNPMVRLTKENM